MENMFQGIKIHLGFLLIKLESGNVLKTNPTQFFFDSKYIFGGQNAHRRFLFPWSIFYPLLLCEKNNYVW